MTTLAQLNEDIKAAMRAKEARKLSTLRGLKASLTNLEMKKSLPLTESDMLATIRFEAKKRIDTLASVLGAGRKDIEDEANEELLILKDYLPKELSEEELTKIVLDAIAEAGATSKKDMGKVMKIANAKVNGAADGKTVSSVVQKLLP